MAYQVDDHLPTDQRPPPPVLGDVAEHAVLDLVPLTRPWREVTHGDAQPDLVCQPLQLHLPQAAPAPVRPTAVPRNPQTFRPGVDLAAHVPPPSAYRLYCKLGRVMIDPHADPAAVGRLVIDAIGNDLAHHLVGKVMDVDLFGLPGQVPLAAAITELAHEFFLL